MMENNKQELQKRLEGLLFASGEPVKKSMLLKTLDISSKLLEEVLEMLEMALRDRGIRLANIGDTVTLVTAPEVSEDIRKVLHQDLEGNLSNAALESLSIILYKGEVSKPEIDYIRGVNSSTALYTLFLRGLLSREVNPKDARTFIYKPTMEVLKYLGITSVDELSNFNTFQQDLASFLEEGNPPESL